MNGFIAKFRAFLQRVFFWHGRTETSSAEFTPSNAHDHALVLQVTESKKIPKFTQIRYAGLVLNSREQRIILGAIGVFLIAGGFAIWAAVNDRMIRVPASGGKVVEAVVGSPKYLNPLYAPTNDPDADLCALLFSGLFRHTSGTLVVPELAEKYEWSSDLRKITITLREGITFHDGTPLTSDDVLFTLRSAKDPTWRSPYASSFRDATFLRIDGQTIAIELKEPNMNFMNALTIGILPAHIWQDIPPSNALLADANIRPVGAGPFIIRSLRRSASGNILAYTLDRFDRYVGIAPRLNSIEFRFFADHDSAEEALRGGRVDTLAFVPGQDIAKLTKSDRLKASALELPQSTIAFFNTNDALLKDPAIRQALSLAIDRAGVIEAQGGSSQAISGPYPFDDTSIASSTEERLAEARTILDKAGWAFRDGSDIRSKITSPATSTSKTKTAAATSTPAVKTDLTLTMTVPDVPDLVSVANVLARQWSILGLRVEVRVEPFETLIANMSETRNAQIILWNVLLNASQDLYPMWWSGQASGSGLNLSNLKDRDVDDALKAVQTATTTQTLADAQTRVTKTILARTPAIFLTRPSYGYLHSTSIKGMSDRIRIGSPSDRFTDIHNWYVKTTWRWK
ncbi:MAG: ABC transporter substrate-binding protein [Candidatus Uhrbacteria bacterium]|nr:ABC transporter substrate-binding protein [Candidatus Uhrbacteria bacterium]